MNTIEQTNAHIMQTYGRSDVVLDNASGATVHDADGKTYIDFGSGIGTASLGYCNQAWADAVCEQVRKLPPSDIIAPKWSGSGLPSAFTK